MEKVKKKILAFANGWGESIVDSFMSGLIEGVESEACDIYLFVNYAIQFESQNVLQAENNIYNLPDFSDFDGAVIIGNGLDIDGVFDSICEKCKAAGIPFVTTGRAYNDSFFVGFENESGMKSLVSHLVKEHGYKDFFFFAGSASSPDSRIRLEILKEELAKDGLTLRDESVVETGWSPEVATKKIEEMVRSGEKLPDVFVCANDILAVAVVATLTNLGVKVPEEVAVTGFDNISYAGKFVPAIATVDPNFETVGRKSGKKLLDIMAGEKKTGELLVQSSFIPSESCGCSFNPEEEMARLYAGREDILGQMSDSLFEQKLTMIERSLVFCDDYDEFVSTMGQILYENHDYEGPGFHIVLDPWFKDNKVTEDYDLLEEGYREQLDASISFDEGHMELSGKLSKKDLIPFGKDSDQNRIFMFLPLNEDKYTLGYMVFCDDVHKVSKTSKLFTYIRRIDLVLGKIKQNMTVKKLVDTLKRLNSIDTLTAVKNRNAFEEKEKEFDELISQGTCGKFTVVIFDVNNLKIVNDSKGHSGGDEYLIDCCRFICDSFKKSPVYRIGGDEFLAISENGKSGERSIESIVKDMMFKMHTIGVPSKAGVNISIAVGFSEYTPDRDSSFNDVFVRADDLMYENKAKIKGTGNVR